MSAGQYAPMTLFRSIIKWATGAIVSLRDALDPGLHKFRSQRGGSEGLVH